MKKSWSEPEYKQAGAVSVPARRKWLQALSGFVLFPALQGRAQFGETEGDPLGSLLWPYLRRSITGGAPVVFTDAIRFSLPQFAEDPFRVPLLVDARELEKQAGPIERIVLLADRNPIQKILSFQPMRSLPVLGLRFRLEQASPVRALVYTRKGAWFVGSSWIEAAGGGCTAPDLGGTKKDWETQLYRVSVKAFPTVFAAADSMRLRVQVKHPMDTGLVAGIPPFFIQSLQMQNTQNQLWWHLELYEPVAENPLFTFELHGGAQGLQVVQGQDNSGGKIFSEFVL